MNSNIVGVFASVALAAAAVGGEEIRPGVLRTPDERFADLPDFDFEPHYREIDGYRIHYLDEGPRDGQPILLIHGEPTWSYLYRKMIPVLTAAGHRCIVPDLIGFGRSDKPISMDTHTYAFHVGAMTKLVEALELENVTLFGQDWGGLIGLRVAAENEERFARIVIANTGLPIGRAESLEALPADSAFVQWKKRNLAMVERGDIDTGTLVANVAGDPSIAAAYDAPFPEPRYKAGALILPQRVPMFRDDPANAANREAWEVFRRWEKPFLTAFSDSDPVSRGGYTRFQAEIPGAQGQKHTTIEGAGHFLQEQKGEELARVIVQFIEDNPLPADDTEHDLLGYRASLYPTDYPTERKNLNGTNSLMGVGFSRDVTVDEIVVDTIEMPYPTLLYTREADEVFVLGGTPLAIANYVSLIDGLPPGENETAPYIAKFNPETGEIVYLDLDRGTGIPYLGGALVHADGYVYVVFQNHLYRLEPESMVIEASVDLPTDGPATVYNGLLVGRSGQLILKAMNFGDGKPTLSLIDPETLETVFSTDCACASARFALAVDENGVEHLYHLNREETFRYVVEEDSLTLDETWIARFDPDGTGVNEEPTSPVVIDGQVFYTTNTSFRSTTPMRVFWQDVNATYAPEMPPLGGPLLFEDPEGRTGFSFSGLSADTATGIVFANDQGRGLVNAFRPTDDGEIEILWQRELRVSSGNTSVSDRQMVYFTDYVDGSNHLVVLDLLTGDELLRIPTPATRATIGGILLLPNGDVYLASNEPGEPTGFLVRFSVP